MSETWTGWRLQWPDLAIATWWWTWDLGVGVWLQRWDSSRARDVEHVQPCCWYMPADVSIPTTIPAPPVQYTLVVGPTVGP